jgi:hypothetical protein
VSVLVNLTPLVPAASLTSPAETWLVAKVCGSVEGEFTLTVVGTLVKSNMKRALIALDTCFLNTNRCKYV